jgi:putative DNA primase/helicase
LATTATLINGISGEDGQTIERKGIGDWHGRLGVRFLLAGNILPNFSSATGAMATRLLIVPFEVSFLGREDRELLPKLLRELPGILNWALDGLDDLRMRGDFVEPEASRLAKVRLLNKSHPIHGFVTERCTVKPLAVTDKAVLFAEFIRYCEEVKARPSSLADFTEKLEETFLSVKATKRRQGVVGLSQVPCYRGIRFTDEMLARVYKTKAPDPALAADLAELGLEPDVRSLLARDAAGYPIPRVVHEFD